MLSAYFDKASEFLISLITGVIVCITDMITLKHTKKKIWWFNYRRRDINTVLSSFLNINRRKYGSRCIKCINVYLLAKSLKLTLGKQCLNIQLDSDNTLYTPPDRRMQSHLQYKKIIELVTTEELQWLEHWWDVYHGCFKLILESLQKLP